MLFSSLKRAVPFHYDLCKVLSNIYVCLQFINIWIYFTEFVNVCTVPNTQLTLLTVICSRRNVVFVLYSMSKHACTVSCYILSTLLTIVSEVVSEICSLLQTLQTQEFHTNGATVLVGQEPVKLWGVW